MPNGSMNETRVLGRGKTSGSSSSTMDPLDDSSAFDLNQFETLDAEKPRASGLASDVAPYQPGTNKEAKAMAAAEKSPKFKPSKIEEGLRGAATKLGAAADIFRKFMGPKRVVVDAAASTEVVRRRASADTASTVEIPRTADTLVMDSEGPAASIGSFRTTPMDDEKHETAQIVSIPEVEGQDFVLAAGQPSVERVSLGVETADVKAKPAPAPAPQPKVTWEDIESVVTRAQEVAQAVEKTVEALKEADEILKGIQEKEGGEAKPTQKPDESRWEEIKKTAAAAQAQAKEMEIDIGSKALAKAVAEERQAKIKSESQIEAKEIWDEINEKVPTESKAKRADPTWIQSDGGAAPTETGHEPEAARDSGPEPHKLD